MTSFENMYSYPNCGKPMRVDLQYLVSVSTNEVYCWPACHGAILHLEIKEPWENPLCRIKMMYCQSIEVHVKI